MNVFHRFSLAAAVFAAAIGPAAASTVGFSLKVSTAGALGGTFDKPGFTLTNLSDAGLTLLSINFTIGDPAYNFDAVNAIAAPAGGAMLLTTGDTVNGGARTDSFSYSFTSFDPSEFATWTAELDPDSTNGVVDFRTIFFNNGGAGVPNSVATVLFSDTRSLQVTLAATPGQASYTFSASQEDLADVPLPATLPLLAGAFALVGLTRARRGRSNKA